VISMWCFDCFLMVFINSLLFMLLCYAALQHKHAGQGEVGVVGTDRFCFFFSFY
jgi:hypothetical protein